MKGLGPDIKKSAIYRLIPIYIVAKSNKVYYTPIWFKRDNLFHYFSLLKSSENIFYSFACSLPDYVAHESLKEFWKDVYFENMRTGFLLRCQNSLWFVTLKWCIFSHEKKYFSQHYVLALDPIWMQLKKMFTPLCSYCSWAAQTFGNTKGIFCDLDTSIRLTLLIFTGTL